MFRHLAGRRGQIVIPALFVFPSLMIFVWLIVETAKLSREKIRHQFAIDAAAFVEMTNYSDFLNRTAYVNGAFPQRIFTEGFDDSYDISCQGKTSNCQGNKKMRDILYANGAFPCISDPCPANPQKLDNVPQWDVAWGGTGAAQNGDPPNVAPDYTLITQQNANDYWINWDEANSIYKLYVQIYQLLGSVEEAQYSVLQRLSSGHNFLQKSYWLNTGESAGAASEAVSSFDSQSGKFQAKAYCHNTLMFYGNKPVSDAFQGWKEYSPANPIQLPYMQSCQGGPGLFQVMWVDKRQVDAMRSGYDVIQHWQAPNNVFGVNFNQDIQALNNVAPMVHARVTCGESGGKARPQVWPNPTPKFQVRLYP